ncbi:MAG TPA: PAS domain S-box protein, partial [Methanomicrobiales archaeon]|nr:PAS domain S-box protein [Methanomicrobiales archaeon]
MSTEIPKGEFNHTLDRLEGILSDLEGTTPEQEAQIRETMRQLQEMCSNTFKSLMARENRHLQTEEALRTSEERFRSLIETSSDIVLLLDLFGRITYVSPSVERIGGYAPESLVGKNVLKLIHPGDILTAVEAMATARSDPSARLKFEIRIRNASGGWHNIEASGANILDGERVTGFVVNARDITDRKRMEEALQESEEKYRTLVESFPDTVLIHRNGRMEYINPAGLALFGAKSPDEIVGRSIGDLIHPDCHATIRESVARDMQGEPSPDVELLAVRLDGTTVPVEGRGRRIVYQGEPALQAIIRDITERKKAEEAQRESETTFQALLDSLENIAIQGYGPDGTVHYWNKANESVYGYTAEEAMGRNLLDL